VTIGLSRSSGSPRLAGSAGGVLPRCAQKFGLDVKEAGFDRAGTPKSPQQTCESMNQRKLEHGSRINTADEDALEHSVGSSIFEFPNNGLVSKPTTPSATA
jgi:hypothetical protein